jgi:site-specific DNA-cytosine methylase
MLASKAVHVEAVVISRGSSSLDLYVAGAVTAPFTNASKRHGFANFNARTLIQFMRTVSALKPRAAILENMPAILRPKHRKHLDRLLSAVSGYRLKIFDAVDNRNFGLPQNRVMMYFVFLRIDALALSVDASMAQIDNVMRAAVVDKCPTFHEFFADSGDALIAQSALNICVDHKCTCSYYKCCERHKCRCKICCVAGRQTKLCRWRSETSRYMRKSRMARAVYLNNWRLVKKDATLKRSPTYFELARTRGISVDGLRFISPRQRVMLNSLSLSKNLLSKDVIIDLANSISKPIAIRSDGITPILGRTCSRLLVPSVAKLISARQCLLLHGIDPDALDLTHTRDDDIFRMVGSAMGLPAIGTLLMACISVLRW